jgi:hypothetical protein
MLEIIVEQCKCVGAGFGDGDLLYSSDDCPTCNGSGVVPNSASYRINGEEVCRNEYDHAERAENLERTFRTVEALADFLHQQYRAAAKALHTYRGATSGCTFRHDHGWAGCPTKGKKYFTRRAAWLLTLRPSFNGRKVATLGNE